MDISVAGALWALWLSSNSGVCLYSVPITLQYALLNHLHILKVTEFNQESLLQPCTRTNSRVRTAYTLRSPSVGRQCPDTTNREPCSLNLNCFNYFYNITGKMMHCLLKVAVWRQVYSSQQGHKNGLRHMIRLKITVKFILCVWMEQVCGLLPWAFQIEHQNHQYENSTCSGSFKTLRCQWVAKCKSESSLKSLGWESKSSLKSLVSNLLCLFQDHVSFVSNSYFELPHNI